jgi:hypothetical protein
MYIVAVHDIADAEKFWAGVKEAAIPEGIALHSSLPNATGSRAVCLWEAESLGAVRDLVEATVGPYGTNEYFEVDARNALGLPR